MAFNRANRNNGEQKQAKRILVPVKGSLVDDEAMRLAYTYALARMDKGRDVSVDVVYVVEVPHALALDAELSEQVDKGERALDNAETCAREMGLKVTTSILQARNAGAAIVDVSRESASELIVMATDYLKKHGELDLGRTIPYVMKHAPCRVWLCRAPELIEEPAGKEETKQ